MRATGLTKIRPPLPDTQRAHIKIAVPKLTHELLDGLGASVAITKSGYICSKPILKIPPKPLYTKGFFCILRKHPTSLKIYISYASSLAYSEPSLVGI